MKNTYDVIYVEETGEEIDVFVNEEVTLARTLEYRIQSPPT